MGAYRERIYLFPGQSGEPGWIMAFPLWWDRRQFFKKYGDRRIDTNSPFYVDYGMLLTMGEAIAYDKQCRQEFTQKPGSQKTAEVMRLFEERLKQSSWVVVESYEWESGLE